MCSPSHNLQNPRDCSTAKFLTVSLDRPCAFGCNTHHLAYCFQLAYATNRTLVFTADLSSYRQWWSSSFEPLSSTCTDPKSNGVFEAPGRWHKVAEKCMLSDRFRPLHLLSGNLSSVQFSLTNNPALTCSDFGSRLSTICSNKIIGIVDIEGQY